MLIVDGVYLERIDTDITLSEDLTLNVQSVVKSLDLFLEKSRMVNVEIPIVISKIQFGENAQTVVLIYA